MLFPLALTRCSWRCPCPDWWLLTPGGVAEAQADTHCRSQHLLTGGQHINNHAPTIVGQGCDKTVRRWVSLTL